MKNSILFLFLILPLSTLANNGWNVVPLAAHSGDTFSNVISLNGTNLGTTYTSNNVAPRATASNPTNQFVSSTLYTNANQRSLLFGYANGCTLNYTNSGNPFSVNVTNNFCVPLDPLATFKFSTGNLSNVVEWQE